ncbi:MAG: hypothetical protein H6712_32590 [Myxococcales bacterium]|nr:hypothetical protein [Myxococcales bacterium]
MQFSPEELDLLAEQRPHTAARWIEPKHHVQAFAVVDHGGHPALGELRMSEGAEVLEALRLACRLARSHSIRAGLLGLPRAGAAVVVVDDPRLDHGTLHRMLEERLGGAEIRVRSATSAFDPATLLGLAAVSADALTELRARALDACLAPLELAKGARALVLGAGDRGRDAARALRERGLEVAIWDEDPARAEALASAEGIAVRAEPWLDAETELLVPCTTRPRVDEAAAPRIRATVVCGLAPWVVASPAVGRSLEERGITVVPSLLSAAAELVALAELEGLRERAEALALLASTAAELLAEPRGASERAVSLAIARAQAASAS